MSVITVAKKHQPKPADELKTEKINLMAELSWKRRVEDFARRQGMTASQYIRWSVNNQMNRDAREPGPA